MDKSKTVVSVSPDKTFELGEELGAQLKGGDVILLTGGLGAGKTLFTKGVLNALSYDIDEVTSPSFTLVNLYKAAPFDVYHIDLWRTRPGEDAAFAIGLDEILEEGSAVKIIEWAERLGQFQFDSLVYTIDITGDGDEPRTIKIEVLERSAAKNV
ncbi:MAG: tRNA (adenosine(37)-N6)-threonylcarbamoyltransferase complex ATPase subunit type 1 TsaE [Blastocatellia bacterium]|nr:tRNA (adenosine(37)-N6)-threonylcarbamoyltransferase complex ATPase subunit type 1 TsaE [Blastocatellia bacterium]